MPWCPKCRNEYREGFNVCNDCNAELVDKLEEIPEEQEDHEAFLTTADGSIEAEIIEGLLNSNGIPVLKKYREAEGYMTIYTGGSKLGVDLFVPSKLLDKAAELIKERNEGVTAKDEIIGTDDINSIEQDEEYKKSQRLMKWALYLFFGAGIILIIIFIIFKIIG